MNIFMLWRYVCSFIDCLELSEEEENQKAVQKKKRGARRGARDEVRHAKSRDQS